VRPARTGPAGLLLAAGLAAAALGGWAGQTQAPAPGPVVRLSYRALQPGEPILVVLESGRTVRSAAVTFLERTADLRPGPQKQAFMAFLGIDVQTKPGPYVLTVTVHRADGSVEKIRKDLLVVERKFPSTKLTLDPNYVTPPASVRDRIKREAELIALAMSVVTPEWLGDGPFVVPNPAPSWSNFGQRRLNNNVLQSLHAGLDLRVPFGQPIQAANAGRVVMASDLYMGGKTVIIDHGLGVFSTYGHMSELLVKRGDAVKKGQTVGLCGTTGRSTGPHLHWSFRILDARVDPDAMLRLPL
jgi:murein DD-endopeptidase MepM/ murein hydrolase activator NlpD